MASKFLRKQTWWVKFQHPVTKERVRESLSTNDEAKAELLRQRIELEVQLLEPRFKLAALPDCLKNVLTESLVSTAQALPAQPSIAPAIMQTLPGLVPMPAVKRVPIREAIGDYIAFIRAENSAHHARSKVSMLRRFLGSKVIFEIIGETQAKHSGRPLEVHIHAPGPAIAPELLILTRALQQSLSPGKHSLVTFVQAAPFAGATPTFVVEASHPDVSIRNAFAFVRSSSQNSQFFTVIPVQRDAGRFRVLLPPLEVGSCLTLVLEMEIGAGEDEEAIRKAIVLRSLE